MALNDAIMIKMKIRRVRIPDTINLLFNVLLFVKVENGFDEVVNTGCGTKN